MLISIYRKPYSGHVFAEYTLGKHEAWPSLVGHTSTHDSLDDLYYHMMHLIGLTPGFFDAWRRAKDSFCKDEPSYPGC